MNISKYYKPLDFIHFGMYVAMFGIFMAGGAYVLCIFMVFSMLHYFPLIYLLRRHGYLHKKGDYGYIATKKGEQLFRAFMITPLNRIAKYILSNTILATLLYCSLVILALWASLVLYQIVSSLF